MVLYSTTNKTTKGLSHITIVFTYYVVTALFFVS